MQHLREKIDKLDTQLIALLKQRFEISCEVGEYKKTHSLPVLNEEREKQILSTLPTTQIIEVYKEILKQSRELQK